MKKVFPLTIFAIMSCAIVKAQAQNDNRYLEVKQQKEPVVVKDTTKAKKPISNSPRSTVSVQATRNRQYKPVQQSRKKSSSQATKGKRQHLPCKAGDCK